MTTATRRVYTDKDRAAVFAELTVNNGNVKRTARNLAIPVPTVRRWRDVWKREGVPQEVSTAVAVVRSDFLTDAIRTRDKLLTRIEEIVDSGGMGARDAVTALGVLSDKIRAYEGLPDRQVEHTFQLPPPDEIRLLFANAVEGVVLAAKVRTAEIEGADESVDGEYIVLDSAPDTGGSTP